MTYMPAFKRTPIQFCLIFCVVLLVVACGQKSSPPAEKKDSPVLEQEDVSKNMDTRLGRALVNFVNANKDLFKNSILLEQSEETYKREVMKALREGAFNELTYSLLTFRKSYDVHTYKEFLEATFTVELVGKNALFEVTYFVSCSVPDSLIPKMIESKEYRLDGDFYIEDTAAYKPMLTLNMASTVGSRSSDYPDFAKDGMGMKQQLSIHDHDIDLKLRSVTMIDTVGR